jgi:hypothetical protein
MVPARPVFFSSLGFLIFLTAACSSSNEQLDDLRRQAEDAARDASAQIENLRDSGSSGSTDTIPNDEVDAGSLPAEKPKNDGGGAVKPDAGGADSGTTCPPVGQVFTSVEGPFCPFQQGGVFDHCAVGEHCCHYPIESGLSATCNAGAVACAPAIANGFDWRCDETNDCPATTVCCFAGSITPIPQCPGTYSHVGSSTACRSSCTAATEMQTCGSQSDCPIGKTCTGVRIRGKHIGLCR